MRLSKISIEHIYCGFRISFFLIALFFHLFLYFLTKNKEIILASLAYTFVLALLISGLTYLIRKKVGLFSKEICHALDMMINESRDPEIYLEEETLFSKINHHLIRLHEMVQANRFRVIHEKKRLQQLISDISHQIKTPMANLKILNETLLERNLSKKEQKEFLQGMDGQLNKLDFLIASMLKTSRLETGMITLHKEAHSLYETIANALGGIFLAAEKKQLQVSVSCNQDLILSHDKKWTTEALFNLLDNAVKYTRPGGKIQLSVEVWEGYTKIDIKDNGIGILEKNQGKIFKRFYREEAVSETEGIGIGLYLAREIITIQGGFIKVSSVLKEGSVFSVFLPNP